MTLITATTTSAIPKGDLLVFSYGPEPTTVEFAGKYLERLDEGVFLLRQENFEAAGYNPEDLMAG